MANDSFQSGDVVELKSGSPAMTVKFVNEGTAHSCYYDYNTNVLHESVKLPVEVLKKYQKKVAAF